MINKFEKLTPNEEEVKKVEKNVKEVKLKSEMYNHDNEKIEKREEEDSKDAVMWGFVLGFMLFFILLILIVVFTN